MTGIRTTFELTGRVVALRHAAHAAAFECSDELVNQLWRNIHWGQRGNFLSVPTDCPQRDERLGWLADAQVFLPTASLNMDVAAFMTKWGDDMLDAQSPDGAYPDVAPRLRRRARRRAGVGRRRGHRARGRCWRRYGDRRLLERHWDAMERYMAYLLRHNPDLLWTARRGNDYGDWLSVGAAHAARRAGDRLLGLRRAAHGRDRATRSGGRSAPRTTSACAPGSSPPSTAPTSATTPTSRATRRPPTCSRCTWTCCPRSCAPRAAERLVENIERHDGHLTTGFVGVGLLCPVLSEAGYGDVAHRLLLNETFPSWGYSIRHGATTIWERWDGWTEDGGFQTPTMNSFNHYSLGSVGQWLYEYVAGIRAARSPATSTSLIAPEPGELEWARAAYRSVRGPITSAWRQEGDALPRSRSRSRRTSPRPSSLPGGETLEVGSGRQQLQRAPRRPRFRARARSRAPERAALSGAYADLRVDVAEVELDRLGAQHQLV